MSHKKVFLIILLLILLIKDKFGAGNYSSKLSSNDVKTF